MSNSLSQPPGENRPVYSQSFSRSQNRGSNFSSDQSEENNYNPAKRAPRPLNHSYSSEKVIKVDTRKLGCIIGIGAQEIKKMEQESHTRIQVSKERSADVTDVTILGSESDIATACQLIEARLKSDQPNQSGWGNRDQSQNQRNSNYEKRGQREDRQNTGRSYDSRNNYDNSANNYSSNQTYSNYNQQSNNEYKNRNPRHENNYSNDDKQSNYENRNRGNPRYENDGRTQYNNRNNYQRDNRYNSRFDNENKSENNQSNYRRDNRNNSRYGNDNNSQYNNTSESNSNSASAPQDDFQPIDWQALYEESERQAAAKLAALPPIVKNLYIEDPEVAQMSLEEVEKFRSENMGIKVARIFANTEELQTPVPNPVRTFEQAFRSYPDILQTIYDQKFEKPSPIQTQAWPVILSGEDMIGIAQTGTGKTLAFLLPALIHIESQTVPRAERAGPTVLILSPTRELAIQIEKEINKYCYHGIKCVCVYGGGGNRNYQCKSLDMKPEIVVATPGRLEDFLGTDNVSLDSVTYVVLDEADKMLEMGFECQIRRILLKVRSDRQSIMTSATWPSAVSRLASQYSSNPVQVIVGSLDLTAVHSVSQRIEIIDEENKRDYLTGFLAQMEPDDKVIVFCGKKSVTDDIASDLLLQGVKVQSIHGDREQCDREQALQDLKSGEVRILIATDVAARGIDIADITHVFNYDFPKLVEEYVHRIGRTGRAGKTGESISLFTRRDWANAAQLISVLEEANQGVPDELRGMAERFERAQKKNDNFGRGGPRQGRGGGRQNNYRQNGGSGGGGGGRPRY